MWRSMHRLADMQLSVDASAATSRRPCQRGTKPEASACCTSHALSAGMAVGLSLARALKKARSETWRPSWARCWRWAKNSSSSAWMLLRMPLSNTASSAGKGSLRARVNALGKSGCRAKSRNWLECRCSEKARSSCSNMAANRDKKGLYWPPLCPRKSLASRAAAARSVWFVKRLRC